MFTAFEWQLFGDPTVCNGSETKVQFETLPDLRNTAPEHAA